MFAPLSTPHTEEGKHKHRFKRANKQDKRRQAAAAAAASGPPRPAARRGSVAAVPADEPDDYVPDMCALGKTDAALTL